MKTGSDFIIGHDSVRLGNYKVPQIECTYSFIAFFSYKKCINSADSGFLIRNSLMTFSAVFDAVNDRSSVVIMLPHIIRVFHQLPYLFGRFGFHFLQEAFRLFIIDLIKDIGHFISRHLLRAHLPFCSPEGFP